MLASDSIRGASIVFNTKLNDVMLHKDACQCITNLGRSKTINLKIADNKVLGTSDNFIFITTIDSDYPYSQIKPILDEFSEDKDLVIKFDPDNLIDKLNRVLMFADTDTNSVFASINKKDFVLSVENKASAREVINAFENISGKEMSLLVDGKNLREALSKSLSETRWITDGENDVQYIYDGSLLQFFKGLES